MKEDKIYRVIGHIIMIIISLNAILPMVLLVMSSITDNDTLIRNGYNFFPEKFSFKAYSYIFKTGSAVVDAYGISILLTLTGTTLAIIITTLLGYALSKPDLPGRGLMTFYVFFTLLFNGGLVPTYMNYTKVFDIKDTFWGLLIPSLITNGFNILLMKSYFVSSIPPEILDAAYVDGANEVQVLSKVVVPLAKPIIATIGLFSGIAYWNDWQNGYIYLTRRTDLYSIQNLLNRMMQSIQYLSQNSANISNSEVGLASIPNVSVRMAIAVIGVLPVIIVYPFIQNSFVKGITLGGVKG